MKVHGIVDDTTVRCPVCMSLHTDSDIENLNTCPDCGTHRSPQYVCHDVTVTLNWDEIRLLTTLAANAAMEFIAEEENLQDELMGVIDKLNEVKPVGSGPLTLDEAEEDADEEEKRRAITNKLANKVLIH